MDSNAIILSVQDKLPKDPLVINDLREKLNALDDAKKSQVINAIPTLKLKSPTLVFWIGNFFFGTLGVGRFMIGDIGLGIARLFVTIFYLIFIAIGSVLLESGQETAGGILMIVGVLFAIAMWIWWIVDLCIVGKKLRKKNLEKILNIL